MQYSPRKSIYDLCDCNCQDWFLFYIQINGISCKCNKTEKWRFWFKATLLEIERQGLNHLRWIVWINGWLLVQLIKRSRWCLIFTTRNASALFLQNIGTIIANISKFKIVPMNDVFGMTQPSWTKLSRAAAVVRAKIYARTQIHGSQNVTLVVYC